MPNLIQLNQELELLDTFGQILLAYEENYMRILKRTRLSVFNTRNYINGLTELFKELKTLYQYQLALSGKKTDNDLSKQSVKNGRSVVVLLSGTHLFTGEINHRIFNNFLNHIQNNRSDIVIVGRIGKNLYEQHKLTQLYQSFELPERKATDEDIQPLMNFLTPYEKVDIFLGKYINVINQTETQSNITGDVVVDLSDPTQYKTLHQYIFEPNLVKILNFFERQIFRSILKQTLNESYLAQIGSRIVTMEESTQRIETELRDLNLKQLKFHKQLKNRKQLQQLVSVQQALG